MVYHCDEQSYKEEIIQAALRKQDAERSNLDVLAGNYAFKMLYEIRRIMDNETTSLDDKYNSILKILCFLKVPPHI